MQAQSSEKLCVIFRWVALVFLFWKIHSTRNKEEASDSSERELKAQDNAGRFVCIKRDYSSVMFYSKFYVRRKSMY